MELEMIVLRSLFLSFFVGSAIGSSCKNGCKLPSTPLFQWKVGEPTGAAKEKSCAQNGNYVRLIPTATAKSADGNDKYITFICEDRKLRHLRQPSCGDEIVVENVVSDKKGFIKRLCTVRSEGMKDLKWYFHPADGQRKQIRKRRSKGSKGSKRFVIDRKTGYSFESTLYVAVKEDLMGSYQCVANYKKRHSQPLSSHLVVLKGPQCNTTWLQNEVDLHGKNGNVGRFEQQSFRPMTDSGQSVLLECFEDLPNIKVTCKFGKWTIEKERAGTDVTSACWRCPPPETLIPEGSPLKIVPKTNKSLPGGHIGAQYEIYCPGKGGRKRGVTATCVSSKDFNKPRYEMSKDKLPECVKGNSR
eukprot:m.69753 g.69753  ORF g.69753 m.69753 type:complete len:358 (+) comp35626_c0_seq6:526-1599(+)